MAARILVKKWRDPSLFISALSSAFSELSLIIILLLDGLLTFFAIRLARYCKLRAPCLLCSRLDGFLEDLNLSFYKELFCDDHKSDISSLAFCSSHRTLSDAQEMCDRCLISFLGTIELRGEDKGSVARSQCTCCSRPFRNRPLAHRLSQWQKPIGTEPAEPNYPLPASGKPMSNSSRSLTVIQGGERGSGQLPHVCYSELKITSDTESEVPISEEDEHSALARATDNLKEKILSRDLQLLPMAEVQRNLTQIISDDVVPERLICPSLLISEKGKMSASHSNASIVNLLEETNWSQVDGSSRPNSRPSSEIPTEQVPPEGLNTKLHAHETEFPYGETTKIFASTDLSFKVSGHLMNEKIPSGIRGHYPSLASVESFTSRESSRVPEDLKVRLSQISSSRWPDYPWNDMNSSPRPNGQGDETTLSDASSSMGFPNQTKRYYLDRYEAGFDEGSVVSEVEGEGTVDRLKRQIEMDRRSMGILYKELEEERNASAIAVNQAMAMINRLQEEKASMQMEALQYLRLMEEQTEYDQEALQKLNDLLADRDKEIQDLESEVDSYRKQFGFEPLPRRAFEASVSSEEEREYREYTPVSTPRVVRPRRRETIPALVKNTVLDFDDEKVYISECLKRLERKLQSFSNTRFSPDIVQEEEKEDEEEENENEEEENEEEVADRSSVIEEHERTPNEDQEYSHEDNKKESVTSKESSLSREESFVIKCSTPSAAQEAIQSSFREAFSESRFRSISYNDRQFQMVRKNDINSFGSEISQLTMRLEALEADKIFIENAVDSLKNGSNGLQLIQEIACHLRELRKIGVTHQQHSIA